MSPRSVMAPQHTAHSTWPSQRNRRGTHQEEIATSERKKTKQVLASRANLVGLAMKEDNERRVVMDVLMGANRPVRITNG